MHNTHYIVHNTTLLPPRINKSNCPINVLTEYLGYNDQAELALDQNDVKQVLLVDYLETLLRVE